MGLTPSVPIWWQLCSESHRSHLNLLKLRKAVTWYIKIIQSSLVVQSIFLFFLLFLILSKKKKSIQVVVSASMWWTVCGLNILNIVVMTFWNLRILDPSPLFKNSSIYCVQCRCVSSVWCRLCSCKWTSCPCFVMWLTTFAQPVVTKPVIFPKRSLQFMESPHEAHWCLPPVQLRGLYYVAGMLSLKSEFQCHKGGSCLPY